MVQEDRDELREQISKSFWIGLGFVAFSFWLVVVLLGDLPVAEEDQAQKAAAFAWIVGAVVGILSAWRMGSKYRSKDPAAVYSEQAKKTPGWLIWPSAGIALLLLNVLEDRGSALPIAIAFGGGFFVMPVLWAIIAWRANERWLRHRADDMTDESAPR